MFRNVLSLPPLSWEPRKQSIFDEPCHVTCRLIHDDFVLLEVEFILVTLECNTCLAFAQNFSKYSQTSKGRRFDIKNWCDFLFFWLGRIAEAFPRSRTVVFGRTKKKYVEPRSGPSNFPLRIERHAGLIIMFEMLPVNEDLRRPEKKNRASTVIAF